MSLIDNPGLRVLRQSISQYRAKQLDIEGLQRNIGAVMTALEGDVPQDVRDEIVKAESSIEFIRFMVDSSGQNSAVEDVLQVIEAKLSNYSRVN